MMNHNEKIVPLNELAVRSLEFRADKKTIVHCHGVFDLLHIGHIKHLQEAASNGDILLVTLTPDRFVNKGPHRPAFPERLRAEAIAALSCVDFVAINEWATAVETIKMLRPHIYAKGIVKEEGKRDFSDAIEKERDAVTSLGGRLLLTEQDTFSSSTLINRYMNSMPPHATEFLHRFRKEHSVEEIVGYIQQFQDLKVLTIGETILDEYQFCSVMAKANKEPILAAKHLYTEKYCGGILAVANHLAGFCNKVNLLTSLGETDSHEEFIREHLHSNITPDFLYMRKAPTIIKRRFLEEYLSTKLFEIYVMQNETLNPEEEVAFCEKLESMLPGYDVVVIADYGHGLFTDQVIATICDNAPFLAVNAQTNAGNRGYNLISKYPRADYVSIDEMEARLETRDEQDDIRFVIMEIAKKVDCRQFMVTRGKHGCLCYHTNEGFFEIPAFALKLVDRIGAGDAVLAITSLSMVLDLPMEVVGFIGNVAGAEACATIGNKNALEQSSFSRHVSSLLK